MDRRVALLALVMAGPATAWETMPAEALIGLDIRFGSGLQHFYASGRTYHTPRADDPFSAGPRWGYWREDQGRYCAQWPPNARWMCFAVDRDGTTVRFSGEDGGVVLGVIE